VEDRGVNFKKGYKLWNMFHGLQGIVFLIIIKTQMRIEILSFKARSSPGWRIISPRFTYGNGEETRPADSLDVDPFVFICLVLGVSTTG
jgi:hypothetical protein